MLECFEGWHVGSWAATEKPCLFGAAQKRNPQLHAKTYGEGGNNRMGTGERMARRHWPSQAYRTWPLLHWELVNLAGLENYIPDNIQGLCTQERLLGICGHRWKLREAHKFFSSSIGLWETFLGLVVALQSVVGDLQYLTLFCVGDSGIFVHKWL